MGYVIGIDSGGTKSELIAYNLNGDIIYTKIGGFGNPAVNLDKTVNNIISLIGDCVSQNGQEDCLFILVGMASVETGNYAELIKKYVESTYGIKSKVINDAEMACKAYFDNKDGMLAIAGTGSSCYVQKNGQGHMYGGWGHIMGDEGSGYHTVLEVFKSIVFKKDKNIHFNKLESKILHEIGGSSRSEIMDFIYNNEKDKVASLFPIIIDSSLKGDTYAITLLENAGKILADLTYTAYEKTNFKERISIAIKGGVFQNSKIVVNTYENELVNKMKNFIIIKDDISATKSVCTFNYSCK